MQPRHLPQTLFNTARVEAWPGGLLRARGSQDARLLAGADHVLRRKRDGLYLAVERGGELLPLRPGYRREPGLDAAMAALARARRQRRSGIDAVPTLPLDRLHERLEVLGLDETEYTARTGLALVPEPAWLVLAGFDRYRRPTWLHPAAARGWQQLQSGALRDGVMLEAISGYRSHDYQLGIFERKLARGQSVAEILRVNAAPGFSEHHGGRAMDIGTPGEPPAEASFEATAAFAWLLENAAAHGFRLSYPRGNPHGIDYEPWHWAFAG
ncbi:MAG: D-alanyl-D-alanine carboxypeptidase family protein [Lysobacteraceae bacterium]|nr:MAG: D-alanyl-D-alanine carboxypeptidase family protein [Xanthomonadaceae bacterium]